MYTTLNEMAQQARSEGKQLWEIVAESEAVEEAVDTAQVFERMRKMYRAMKYADESYDESLHSQSGMAGGDGRRIEDFVGDGKSILGDYLNNVIITAVKMAESNACMRRIVAAPTAGSCGVLPAVLLSYEKYKSIDEDKMIQAMFVAGGIGEIIASNASISGAEGGCQAEIGSAAAMASGALAYLLGGSTECILNAAALTMKNMLGLTCDPVAGLVEVPCVKRNVSGAVNAVVYSQVALAGVKSVIPVDEVIDSMRRIGRMLPECLRETGKEGLAATKTAIDISQKLKQI